MTAQMPEILLHRGQALDMAEQPLYRYLHRLPRSKRPKFAFSSTACHRGYIGTWEFRDGVLCLVGLHGWLDQGNTEAECDLAMALPWVKGVLPASWVTDRLRCPEGRLLCYNHHGFSSVYERDRSFLVDRGRLVGEYLTCNPPLPIHYRVEPDGRQVCVEWLGDGGERPDPLDGRSLSDAHLAWGVQPEGDENAGYVVGGAVVRVRAGSAASARGSSAVRAAFHSPRLSGRPILRGTDPERNVVPMVTCLPLLGCILRPLLSAAARTLYQALGLGLLLRLTRP